MLHEYYFDTRLIQEVSALGKPVSIEELDRWDGEGWKLSPIGKDGVLFRDENNSLKFFHFRGISKPHIDRLFVVNHSPIHTELRTLYRQVLRTHYHKEEPDFHFDLLVAERVSEGFKTSSLVVQQK